MAGMSDYLETQLINHMFRTSSYTKPSTLTIALCVSAPSDLDTTLAGKEVANSGSYARVALDPDDSNWADTDGADGETSNSSIITFAAPSGNWGTVSHFAICDSATYNGGNMLFYAALNSPVAITSGLSVSFNIGDLTISLN